jgi:DNA-directed RNA polymerase specialized sigma24 family protein
MTEAVNQYDLLIRYLLGVASDAERRAVEEQYFDSDSDLNVLLQAEDELIDDYVRGAHSTSDRALFESNFLCTKRRRQRLELLQSFVQVLAQTESERSVSSENFGQSLSFQEAGRSHRRETSHQQLSLASFTDLLQWLDPDRERAAEKYETIRNGLIKLFASRGFGNPEQLADDTFDRVASKVAHLVETYVGNPTAYFFRVARAVMMEGLKRSAHDLMSVGIVGGENVSDQTYHCLERCLDQLSEANRDLILQYYTSESQSKVTKRVELAQRLGVSSNALRLRVHKIRQALEKCVRSCVQDEKNHVDVPQ